jgi:hypothetical protein
MNQLNLIINALQNCSAFQPKNYIEIDKALAAARSLRELKPVAWGSKSIYGGFEGLSFDKQPRFDTPLYALDEETK